MNRTVLQCSFILLVSFTGLSSDVWAQDDFYASLGNSRSKAIAMGGAFTAIEDDIAALSFNPAAFKVRDGRPGTKFSIHFNPILPFASYDQFKNFTLLEDGGAKRVFGSLLYLIKSVSISAGLFNIGLLFNEEQFIRKQRDIFFDTDQFENNIYHSAVLNVNPSSRVSLGMSGSLVQSTQNGEEIGGASVSYGVLIKTNKWYQVGIMYYLITGDAATFRKQFDRLEDESINIGVAFFPWSNMTVTIDGRNITENNKTDRFASQEFHCGFENNQIPHVSMWGGYYREKDETVQDFNVYSAGVGLLDLNRFRVTGNKLNNATPLLSYAIVFENRPEKHYRWHLLTVGFKF